MEKQLFQAHFLGRADATIKLVGSPSNYTTENNGMFYKCFIFLLRCNIFLREIESLLACQATDKGIHFDFIDLIKYLVHRIH